MRLIAVEARTYPGLLATISLACFGLALAGTNSETIATSWSLFTKTVVIPVALVSAGRSASYAQAGLPDSLRALGMSSRARILALGAPVAGMVSAAALCVTLWVALRVATGIPASTAVLQAISTVVAVAGGAVVASLVGLRMATAPAALALVIGLELVDSTLRVVGNILDLPSDLRSLSWLGAALNLQDTSPIGRAAALISILIWAVFLWPRRTRVRPEGRPLTSRVTIRAVGLPVRITGLMVAVVLIGIALPPTLRAVGPYNLQPQWIADTNAGQNSEDVVRRHLRLLRNGSTIGAAAAGPFLAVIRHQQLLGVHAGIGGQAGVLQLDFTATTLWACARRAPGWTLVRIVSTPDCA
jgi:hypothetical protein